MPSPSRPWTPPISKRRSARSRRFGVQFDDFTAVLPGYPTLADVDSAEALAEYQEKKRAFQAKLKAEGGTFEPNGAGKPKRG